MTVGNPVPRHLSRARRSFERGPSDAGELKHDHERTAARQAQALLVCPPIPRPRGLEVEVWYEPARCLSGDFYDVWPVDASHVALIVGDVSGKGVPAALIAASLQACLRSHLGFDTGICRALREANQYVYARTAPHHFATLFLAMYDTTSNELHYVNAGHNPPFVVRDDGTVERLESTATIVGAFPRWDCRSATVRLQPRDLLFAFTDGITESRDEWNHEYGEPRLLHALRSRRRSPLSGIVRAIAAAGRHFRHGKRQDDVTLVAVRATDPKERPR